MKKGKLDRLLSRSFSGLCALAMAVTMLPAMAKVETTSVSASEVETTEEDADNSGLVVDKRAVLQEDGTYKIDLEAYATGEKITSTTQKGVPLDIVLVIDQSGSMEGKKLEKLKKAVGDFVQSISDNAKASEGKEAVEHRIAIAGYAGCDKSNSKWLNTVLFVNGIGKPYSGGLTSEDYKNALVPVNDEKTNDITASITQAISRFAAEGATSVDYGMKMANKVFANNPIEEGSERKRVTVVFTDGVPTYNSTTFQYEVANAAIKESYETKNTYGADVYTIGMYDSAGKDVTNFMNLLSSNYPMAKSMTSHHDSTEVADGFYKTLKNNGDLSKIFKEISNTIVNYKPNVSLNAQAVMKDVLGEYFELPQDFDANENVSISTAVGTYDDNTKEITFAGAVTDNQMNVTISVDRREINVTGFDYSSEYIASGHPGRKLLVTITGVEAKEEAVTGNFIPTNDAVSGIYSEEGRFVREFPQPETILTSKSYVLDYGKKVTLSAVHWGQDQIKGVRSTLHKFNLVTEGNDAKTKYGSISSVETDQITYVPGKINWDGYDSFYVFGKTAEKYKNLESPVNRFNANLENLWAKVNVIPATSVYYEDDFMSSYEEEDSGVKIVYSGQWTRVNDAETEGADASDSAGEKDTQSAENIRYGYDDIYAEDAKYSGGTAHKVVGNVEYDEYGERKTDIVPTTAEFTFTGTGVDIYSRTDMDTGSVIAYLYNKNDELVKIVDALSFWEGGNKENSNKKAEILYQIPTIFFKDLKYGTYKVVLEVSKYQTANDTVGENNTYYLDGIRVYEPLGDKENSDPVVGKAYHEAGESDSYVKTVRDLLISQEKYKDIENVTASGALYIDRFGDDNTELKIDTYQKYGPKNEVYLSKGNGIAFTMNGVQAKTGKVYIGLKAPEGKKTEVIVKRGEKEETFTISSAADLYYDVTPEGNGNDIVIKNNGDGMLAVTKVRISKVAVETVNIQSTPQLVEAVKAFGIDTISQATEEITVYDLSKVTITEPEPEEESTDETETLRWKVLENCAAAWLQEQ